MNCKCAIPLDEFHGWKCTITDGACEFLFPDAKACAREFGEGPEAEDCKCRECANRYVRIDKVPCSKCENYSSFEKAKK